MSKISLTFHEIIELVELSVKSGKIEKDYPDYLESCRDLGISSYVLNLIIQRAKENQKSKIKETETDYSFFVPAKPKQKNKENSTPEEIQNVVKIEKRTSKTAWLLTLLFFIGCVVEFILLNWTGNKLSESNRRNTELQNVLGNISDMISGIFDDSSFSSWRSSNHEHSSESYTNYNFSASEDDKLSFDCFVSSEFNYDFLTVTLSGDCILSNELVKISGETNSSQSYVFEKSGNYSLNIRYSKDGSVHKNNDNAEVSNIHLHRNYKSLFDNVHSIINKTNN